MNLFSRRLHELSGAYALDALDPAERERFERHALGFAAAGVAAAVALAVVTVSTQDRLNNVQAQNQAIAAVLAAPDAQITSAAVSVGGTATVVSSFAQHSMIFTSSGLPKLANAKVYELWFLSTGSARPAGLLPQPSDGKTAPVLADGLSSRDKVGVTVEPAGGTSSPTTTPILVMTLPD